MTDPLSRKVRRALHPLYRSLETRVHPLRYLFIEITRRCNLACRHCGSDCTTETPFQELTTDEWLRFLEFVGGNFDTRRLMLVLTGGEPLCRPDFEKILGGLRDNRLYWGMVTNGYALDERRLRLLNEARLWSVTVSIDGLEQNHDWLRGRQGSFERALSAVRLLASSKIPMMDVVTCVNPRNLAELPEVARTLVGAGVKKWRLFSIFPTGRAATDPELSLSDGQFRELMDFIAGMRNGAAPGGLAVEYCCEAFLPPHVDREVRDDPYFCRAGICIGSVLCDGSISACPNISRSLVQGNVRTHDFKKVWETGFASFRDRSWMRTGECADCTHWSRCQGNSMHLWDAERGRTARCFHSLFPSS